MLETPSQIEPSQSSDPRLDKSSTRIRGMFGEIASRYDILNHLLSCNMDRSWRRRTVRQVPPHDARPILDVCSGTGDLAFAYARSARKRGIDCRIVAADFCPEMLAVGRDKARRKGAEDQVAFVEADTCQLPFETDRFQIVSVAFGIRNVVDTDRGLAEMTRVCGPGGHVVVLEFSMPRRHPLQAIYQWYFRHVLPRVGQRLARNTTNAYDYLPASVGQFPQEDALADRLRATGLSEVRFYPFTGGIATLYVGSK